jgi:hypothetical protein
MRHDLQRSRPLLYMLEYTVPHSDASAMVMRHYVRVCASLARGMRPRRRCWEQSARLGALKCCGRYLGSMTRTMEGEEVTKELKRRKKYLEEALSETRSRILPTFPAEVGVECDYKRKIHAVASPEQVSETTLSMY